MRLLRAWTIFLHALILLVSGCVNRPHSETEVLTDVRQLTHGFARAGEAYFSPSMRWIIFQATPPGETDYQMYVAALKNASIDPPIRISPMGSKNTCGFFSPDENVVIFASTAARKFLSGNEPAMSLATGYQRSTGTYRWEFPAEMEIFRADAWQRLVLNLEAIRQNVGPSGRYLFKDPLLAQTSITSNDAYDAECAYSPDGKSIVFTSNRTGDLELFAMRPDGSDVVQLTHSRGYDGGAFVSPDGERLVYRSDRAGNDLLQIFTSRTRRDATGKIVGLSHERQLTHDKNVNWGPFWHPDGKHIIYATSAHGHENYELYLMRADGERKTRITFKQGFDGLPVFSPDGKYLMWSSKRTSDGTTQVFIARFKMPLGA